MGRNSKNEFDKHNEVIGIRFRFQHAPHLSKFEQMCILFEYATCCIECIASARSVDYLFIVRIFDIEKFKLIVSLNFNIHNVSVSVGKMQMQNATFCIQSINALPQWHRLNEYLYELNNYRNVFIIFFFLQKK